MPFLINAQLGYLPSQELGGEAPSLKSALALAFQTNAELCLAFILSKPDNYFAYRICLPPQADNPLAAEVIDMHDVDKVCEKMDQITNESGYALFSLSKAMFAVMNHTGIFDGLDETLKRLHNCNGPAERDFRSTPQ